MSTKKMRRWSPGNPSWIRTMDFGDIIVWMKPARMSGVLVKAYFGVGAWGDLVGRAEVIYAWYPRGSDMPWQIMDKPHRMSSMTNTAEEYVDNEWDYGIIIKRFEVPQTHFGHRRFRNGRNHRRFIHRYPMPRAILAALGDL